MTTLLARIEAELQTCTDPVRRTDLMAERACYLARSGDIGEAHRIASELRSHAGRNGESRAMLWVMIIEALVLRFDKLSASSEDRMNRAFALSASLRIDDLADLSAAWLARFLFDRGEFAKMGTHLSRVLHRASVAPISAVMRAAIVVADANRYAGQDVDAQVWYEMARSIAVKLGDRTTMGAIMYNRAAMGLTQITISSDVFGQEVNQNHLRMTSLEIESAASFEVGTKVTSLGHLTELCRARALMLAGRWAEASERFEALATVIDAAEDRPNRPNVRAELAWCWLNAGRREDAAALLSEISMDSAHAMDIDDRVTYLSRLIRLRNEFGRDPPTAQELAAFRTACDDYRQGVEILRAELQRLPAVPGPVLQSISAAVRLAGIP